MSYILKHAIFLLFSEKITKGEEQGWILDKG